MKAKIEFILIIFFSITQTYIYGQFFPDPGDPGTLNEKKREIKEGKHFTKSKPKKIRFEHTNRRYKYHLAFWPECWHDPSLDCGWNKVGRISYGNGGFEYNWHKLHVGWRAGKTPNEIRISAYFHDCNSTEQYFSQEMTTVMTDYQVYVDMFLGEHIIALIVDNTCFGARQKNYFPPNKTSYLHRTFYFGGNCTAPNDMAVLFYDQENDNSGYSDWFNSRDIMTWNASEFESGDVANFYAYKTINGSSDEQYVSSSLICYPKQLCVIKQGADISFTAGENVILHKGFHAEKGSHFVAKIKKKKKNNKFNIFSKKLNLPPLEQNDSIVKSADIVYFNELNETYDNTFAIYPNPSSGILTLLFKDGETEKYDVEIKNMTGKTVYRKNGLKTEPQAVDLRNQPQGIYVIIIKTGNKIYTKKIVINN